MSEQQILRIKIEQADTIAYQKTNRNMQFELCAHILVNLRAQKVNHSPPPQFNHNEKVVYSLIQCGLKSKYGQKMYRHLKEVVKQHVKYLDLMKNICRGKKVSMKEKYKWKQTPTWYNQCDFSSRTQCPDAEYKLCMPHLDGEGGCQLLATPLKYLTNSFLGDLTQGLQIRYSVKI